MQVGGHFFDLVSFSNSMIFFSKKTKIETSGIGTLGDANILTLPLQRLAKYPFLLDQIIKNTSDTCSSLVDLEESYRKSNEFQQTINNAIDEEINRVKFDWLQAHVDCRTLAEVDLLICFCRTIRERERNVFLDDYF